jgi:hypothetical protein
MRLFRSSCRALLLGIGLTACDVAQVALDPTVPGIVQTWNFPASDSEISVSSLLPGGVGFNSDTSAFTVDVDSIDFNRRLGGYCGLCELLNGTTTQKPAFIISPDTGSEAKLPADVRGGSVMTGKVYYSIENTFSFDPIRINSNLAQPQGWMTIVVRAGSLVLGRDSINGATTAMPPGFVYLDSIPLSTGNITGDIVIDLTVNSPQGPASEPKFINANGRINAKGDVVGLEISSARIDVVNKPLDSGDPVELPRGMLPEGMIDKVVGGRLEMTMLNPFLVTGDMNVQLEYQPGQSYSRLVAVPSGATPQVRNATYDETEMRNILRGEPDPTNPDEALPSTLSIGGIVTSGATPISVTPRQAILITNRLILQIRAFGTREN